jgi:hypothetical protein
MKKPAADVKEKLDRDTYQDFHRIDFVIQHAHGDRSRIDAMCRRVRGWPSATFEYLGVDAVGRHRWFINCGPDWELFDSQVGVSA